MSEQPGSTGAVALTAEPGSADPETMRPMRADAQRNYQRLVAAAKEVFAQHGGGASMEAIAKSAGVGVGTLYRHFPRRIDIVEAVYRTDVDELVRTARATSDLEDPWAAFAGWLAAFVRYALTKRTFLSELQEAFEKNPDLKVQSRARLEEAVGTVLERAQRAGVVRDDVDGSDLLALLGPMCTSATLASDQSERLLALILDGLRRN